jgi:cysteinyl-tRNA synthetase
MDSSEIRKDDRAPLLEALQKFDEIFAVLADDDGPKMKKVVGWAPTEKRENDISPELRAQLQSGELSDADIESKIAEMETARKSRNFKVSDALRAELTGAGVIIENTKDGIRWRRK